MSPEDWEVRRKAAGLLESCKSVGEVRETKTAGRQVKGNDLLLAFGQLEAKDFHPFSIHFQSIFNQFQSIFNQFQAISIKVLCFFLFFRFSASFGEFFLLRGSTSTSRRARSGRWRAPGVPSSASRSEPSSCCKAFSEGIQSRKGGHGSFYCSFKDSLSRKMNGTPLFLRQQMPLVFLWQV